MTRLVVSLCNTSDGHHISSLNPLYRCLSLPSKNCFHEHFSKLNNTGAIHGRWDEGDGNKQYRLDSRIYNIRPLVLSNIRLILHSCLKALHWHDSVLPAYWQPSGVLWSGEIMPCWAFHLVRHMSETKLITSHNQSWWDIYCLTFTTCSYDEMTQQLRLWCKETICHAF